MGVFSGFFFKSGSFTCLVAVSCEVEGELAWLLNFLHFFHDLMVILRLSFVYVYGTVVNVTLAIDFID